MLAQFLTLFRKIRLMTRNYSSPVTKELATKFILDNVEYRKRCLYLQEIIAMGKDNNVWMMALLAFFDTPANKFSAKRLSLN